MSPARSPFVIKLATDANVSDEAIERLLWECYVEDGFTDPRKADSVFRADLVRARGDLLVAVSEDGAVLGCVIAVWGGSKFAHFADSKQAELHLLATTKSARGQGVGRSLVEAVIARAIERGATELLLWSQPSMTAAHSLYERTGFLRDEKSDFSHGDTEFIFFRRAL